MKLRAVALLAVLLVALVPPPAGGAEPERAPWAPHQVSARVTAVALAKEATTLAVANAAVTSEAPSQLPNVVPRTDFRVFDLAKGRLFNSTDGPGGKRVAAASADGRAVVTSGVSLGAEILTYYDVRGAAAPTPGSSEPGQQSPRWSRTMEGPVAAVAVSENGKRVALVLLSLIHISEPTRPY